MNQLFETGKTIIYTLKNAGFEAYFVGGAVRDHVMSGSIHDVDITTNAKPETVEELFPHTIDVGKEHGTVIVLIDHVTFEVTTYRTETDYTDHRRPDKVMFTSHLNEDLKRRDFTMNAMAMTEHYALHDPYNGQDSIRNKIIHTVGSAGERFNEDALRMLRAVRFMSTLKFKLADSVIDAIGKNSETISYVAVERIVVEMRKMYAGEDIKHAKQVLTDTNLIQYIPFFKDCHPNMLMTDVNHLVDELFLQVYYESSLTASLNALKLPNSDKTDISNMLKLADDLKNDIHPLKIAFKNHFNTLKRLQYINNNNDILDVSATQSLSVAVSSHPALPIQNRQDLEINGSTLMTVFNTRGGPWIKSLLSRLEDEVLFNRLQNNQDEILEWVKRHVIIEDGHIKIIE